MTNISMTQIVAWAGVADAILIMAFGLVAAVLFLVADKNKLDTLWSRFAPALGCIIGASFAAALVLASIRWILGLSL